jgi:hypothetical protein
MTRWSLIDIGVPVYRKFMSRSSRLDVGRLASITEESMINLEVVDTGFDATFEAAIHRVQSDFIEMPGLRLTLPQAARLWAYDVRFCRAVLSSLVETRFLVWSRDRFIRAEGRT